MALTIYKASAGSGKTFTLSATYIAHLLTDLDETPHKHQLAVTFTNKATAEMKERILQYLYQLATQKDDSDGFFRTVREMVPSRISNSMMRALARRALLNIIHDYDHFHVTTIDSFFQSLLATLAHDLGLSSSFKVELGDKEVLGKAVERLLANLQENGPELSWVTQYVNEQFTDDKHWNVANELKTLAAQITKEQYMLHSHLLNKDENSSSPEAIKLNNELVDAYKRTLINCMQEEHKKLREKAAAALDAIENTVGVERLNHSNWVLKFLHNVCAPDLKIAQLEPPSASFYKYANGTTPLLKKKEQGGPYQYAADAAVELLAALVAQYEESIKVVNSCILSRANLNPLRLLNQIDHEVKAINRENDRMLLAYTPLLFHDLSLDTDPSFVFERSGTQYQHIMIDEFQDTSKLQWENMKALLVENMAQGNSCMLVGDVKQGIYRFRGGDWNALAGFRPGPSRELNTDVKIETLKTNFRSGRVVVDFNNHFFTHAPEAVQQAIQECWGQTDETPSDGLLNIERIYPTPDPQDDNHEVTQIAHHEGGFVRIEFIDGKEARAASKKAADDADATSSDAAGIQREAAVAAQMMRLHDAGVPYRDMAILVRRNKDVQPLMEYFETHHGKDAQHPIALMSEEAFLLDSSPAVLTIVNALRYVANPGDGIALEYLRHHCPADQDWDSILQLLNTWRAQRYAGLPFYEVACRVAQLFALHRGAGQSPYIYYFLDALLAFIDDHAADVSAFLQYWEETLSHKAIPSAAVEGVRILTIHKSKGLAFHTVFIPYCDWSIVQSNRSELVWTRPSEAPYNAIPILPVYMEKRAATSIYREVYKQETFDQFAENLNLLYVAFTRTRQNLLVWADTSRSGIASILRETITSDTDVVEYGSPSALYVSSETINAASDGWSYEATAAEASHDGASSSGAAASAKSATPLQYTSRPIFIDFTHHAARLQFRQSSNAQHFLEPDCDATDAPTDKAAATQEEYRLTGIILHRLMSTVQCADDLPAAIADAARQGLLSPTLSTERVAALIERRLSHPIARNWFDGSWTLYRECAIITRDADGSILTRRPDRVMVRGNLSTATDETIVVDFKFGKFKAEHREQVRQYMDLLIRQGRHNVRGYLWYLYTGSIEEVL